MIGYLLLFLILLFVAVVLIRTLRFRPLPQPETDDTPLSFDKDAAADLLDSGRSFTALFAASDVMAIGAIRALQDRGLRVPEDVSVMGFDGLNLGSFMVPQLSSVKQPAREMVHRAVEMLIAQIEGEICSVHETVPFEVWERESIAAPKK